MALADNSEFIPGASLSNSIEISNINRSNYEKWKDFL